MKNVFDPKTKEVIQIDETKEKDWMKKYWHLSGVPFEGSQPIEPIMEVHQEIVGPSEEVTAEDLADLHAKYEKKRKKAVPARYKNNAEWIKSKL